MTIHILFFFFCSVPQGTVEEDNVVVSEWGLNSRKVGNNFLWHDDIALSLGGIDSPAAVRMSGTRFSVLSGQLARLERAITNYFLDYFTCEMNYEEISVPLIVTRSTLEGTGMKALHCNMIDWLFLILRLLFTLQDNYRNLKMIYFRLTIRYTMKMHF